MIDLAECTIHTMGTELNSDQELKSIVIENMKKYGGSFVKSLGECLSHADSYNVIRIAETWPEHIVRYRPEAWSVKK